MSMIGTKVKIVSCKRPIHEGCVGLEGVIKDEYDFEGRHFYKIEATNHRFHGWKEGVEADFLKEELQLIN